MVSAVLQHVPRSWQPLEDVGSLFNRQFLYPFLLHHHWSISYCIDILNLKLNIQCVLPSPVLNFVTSNKPDIQRSMKDTVYLQVHKHQQIHSSDKEFSLDNHYPTAMNLTDFRDNALLKLQVGGPFTRGMVDLTNQEYILIQVEQTEPQGQRRRRTQQVGPTMW